MKTDIYLKIENQEQLDKVQDIAFANNCSWWGKNNRRNMDYLFQCQYIIIDEDKKIYRALEENDCDEDKIIDTDLFIRTNGTCEETEDNKMEWTPYDGQELEEEKLYLFCWYDKEMCVVKISKGDMQNFKDNFSGRITAYMELPKPYEKPKSLKERLDEAIEEYCYEFSDEEWADEDTLKHSLKYSYIQNEFVYYETIQHRLFSPFYFGSKTDVNEFINSFTTDELMKIMKGEVK